MARRPRLLIEGGIYHVTCRGNARHSIFKNDRDRQRFLCRLADSAETFQVRVYLYCLMPNHVHLLVETPRANLDRFMGSLLTGYTIYFNRQHRLCGHLFQGRYGAQVVEGNAYLLKLARYIHLNPVQVKAWRDRPLAERRSELRNYAWSSYREYAGLDRPCEWLSTEPVLAQMEGWTTPAAYARFVEGGLARTEDEFAALMKQRAVGIGSVDFVTRIKREMQTNAARSLTREDVAMRHVRIPVRVPELAQAVQRVTGPEWSLLEHRKRGALVRGFYAWVLQSHTGMTQREVAKLLGVGTGAAVSLMIAKAKRNEVFGIWTKDIELIFKGCPFLS
jgi:REP element-mobilizing transposase RayT